MSRPTFCAIIPDRGDRPKLTEFCFRQLDRMTVKPDKVYHVNYTPESDGFDLVERVYDGVQCAFKDGIEWCFIVENDDYYPSTYFEWYIRDFIWNVAMPDIVGSERTIYYNLINRTWQSIIHKGRASLCTTAFKTDTFIADNKLWSHINQFLDIAIWNRASNLKIKKTLSFSVKPVIGIKTGIGLCGGKGHRMLMENKDPHLSELQAFLKDDNEAFEFYRSLSEELYKP